MDGVQIVQHARSVLNQLRCIPRPGACTINSNNYRHTLKDLLQCICPGPRVCVLSYRLSRQFHWFATPPVEMEKVTHVDTK